MFIKKLPELIQPILNIDVDDTYWDGIEKLNFKQNIFFLQEIRIGREGWVNINSRIH